MLRPRAIQPAEKSSGFPAVPVAPRRSSEPRRSCRQAKASNLKCAQVGRQGGREDELIGGPKIAGLAAVLGFALSLVAPLFLLLPPAPARAQDKATTPSRPWLDPALLPAGPAGSSLIVYSSTNEQEGLPLFKLFTDATGIKVEYVL